MIATFPLFGTATVAVAKFFDALEIPYILPTANDGEILKIGTEFSPEEICTPFKYMVGNLKNAYDRGADTAVMTATCGPCRLGEYGQLLTEVMAKAGCDYRWVLLDSPAAIGIGEFAERFKVLLAGRKVSSAKIAAALLVGVLLVYKTDALWKKAAVEAGTFKEPYAPLTLLHETENALREAQGFRESFEVVKKACGKLCSLEKEPEADPVKILVTGEIYTAIEREANGNLREKLMKAGCSVTMHMSVSWWIRNTVIKMIVPDFVYARVVKGRAIPCNIGGYARESAEKVSHCRKYDGIIKVMPVGCMPEIVSKAFCERVKQRRSCQRLRVNQSTKVNKRYGNERPRVLHLIYDEMSGQAGYDTRIEAFTDMLERRKNVSAGNRYRLDKYRFGGYR